MCYTGWCEWEEPVGSHDCRCTKPRWAECPLNSDTEEDDEDE